MAGELLRVNGGGRVYLSGKFSLFGYFFVCFLLFVVILNPYTVYGKPGVVVSLFLVLYSIFKGGYKVSLINNIIIFSVMLFIALWGVFFSFTNGIGQLNHLWVVISFFFTVLSAQALYFLCRRFGIDLNSFLLLILYSLILNYIVVSLEVNYPAVRDVVEGFLAPAGNIDWTEGFRYRGVASSGGAKLSIVAPVAFAITLYLYEEKRVGVIFSLFSFSISLFATLVIGRTGLVLLPLVFVCYMFFYASSKLFRASWVLSFTILVFAAFVLLYFGYGFIFDYFSEVFGIGFINYSFGFLLEGAKGVEEEGTVGIIASFLTVVPKEFPEVFTGYGFYGGSDFSPWTDSGFSRMFLSVGFLWGFIFYLCIFFFYFQSYVYRKFLIFSIGLVLLVAEAKEPVLFSGNSARIFILIVVFIQMDAYLGVLTRREKLVALSSDSASA